MSKYHEVTVEKSRMNIYKVIADAEAEADGKPVLILFRKDENSRWWACIKFEDAIELLKQHNARKGKDAP